jgi:Bacterial mobilisation protein (MobC)
MRVSQLSVVSPPHAEGDHSSNVTSAQQGKGAQPPLHTPVAPLRSQAETLPISAASGTAPVEPRKPNRGTKGGRMRVVAARVSVDEYAVLDAKARDAGISIGSYLRATALGSVGPRARRRPAIHEELAGYAVTQLNRAGNNLNQLARRFNAADAVEANETNLAVAETREAVRQLCRAFGIGISHDL